MFSEICEHRVVISIHALREEGDRRYAAHVCVEFVISIHALREEGDPASVGFAVAVSRFLSTPSARRATPAGGSRGAGR